MEESELRLFNSFTKKKEVFRPSHSPLVKWYICGPTVYDSAHMGHARNYTNFDVLRRVISEYFGYNVSYVMNVTDVDDKLILRAHLLRLQEVIEIAKNLEMACPELDQAEEALGKKDLLSLKNSHEALSAEIRKHKALGDFDVQVSLDKLGRKYEAEFFRDMKTLGVRPPDTVTRVSEYIPEIIRFIEQIISKGFAYEGKGSVYFDTNAFIASPGKTYGKLHQAALDNALLLAEVDFVLWKASKEGEPTWDSPWGKGRPGWHIECSAMCSDLLGGDVDINCGGIDLAFPHHENQLAQSEAYWDCCQWVRYFLHSGHLNIDGLKMSKSLKNFITVEAATSLYTARQLRLMFLLQLWSEPMNLTPQMKDDGTGLKGFMQMEEAVATESTFTEFFYTVKGLVRKMADGSDTGATNWTDAEKSLHKDFMEAQLKVDRALRDSVNTPTAVKTLQGLVGKCNVYMSKSETKRVLLIMSITRYVGRILRIFGLASDDELSLSSGGQESGNPEQILGPHLDAWTAFRDEIRKAAISKAGPEVLLQACDEMRDKVLPELGVRIDDSGKAGIWKLYDPKELKMKMEKEAQETADKKAADAKRLEDLAKAQAEKEKRARIPPEQLFRTGEYEGQYKEFNEQGIPTVDKDGNELTKSQSKKLAKLFKSHSLMHETWKKKAGIS